MTDEGEDRRPKGAAKPADPQLAKWIGFGVGAGIGSAAIAAALLYASRPARKKDGGRG